jgi:glutamyl-tRNA reductase
VIGTGAIAGQIADALRTDGVPRLIVASASLERAEQKAAEWSSKFTAVEPVSFDALAGVLPAVHVVFGATSCTTPVVNAAIIGARDSRLLVVDLGVPRNIDENVSTLSNVLRFDIDDLNQVVEANLAERRREVEPVHRIITEESNGFESWLKTLGVQPVISTLRSRAEEIRRHELDRALRRMDHLSARERDTINALTQAIVSKLLHEPTVRLKEHATEGRGYQFAELVRDLFHLELSR